MTDPLGQEERLQLAFHAGHLLQAIDHDVKRRRVLGRADGPDMQVMPPPQGRHGIEPGRELSRAELAYAVELIVEWIKREMQLDPPLFPSATILLFTVSASTT